MNFGQALEALKAGSAVRLPGWLPDTTLNLQLPDANSKMRLPYLYASSPFGSVPWVASHHELLSERWELDLP